jgi:hypothetical protein
MSAETPTGSADNPGRRRFLGGIFGGVVAGAAGLAVWNTRKTKPFLEKGQDVNPRLFSFLGGDAGPWSVLETKVIAGDALPEIKRVDVVNGPASPLPEGAKWALRGVTSNERYATRKEKDLLGAKQQGLGRPEATRAALIPIRKSAKWWALTQDERRAVLEDRSKHIQIGLDYLPAVARRLHHCRDLGEGEPFDFLTWFEYASADASAFDDLVAKLRASEEWKYVDREIDIRLERERA